MIALAVPLHGTFCSQEVSAMKESPPPRRTKQRPLPQPDSDSELKDAAKRDKDTASIGSTLPRSPTSSTCLSSQSIQSVRDETVLDEVEVCDSSIACGKSLTAAAVHVSLARLFSYE